MPHDDEPVRVSFPRAAWAAIAGGFLLMVAIFAIQLLMLEDQRTTTDRQLRTAVIQSRTALPILRAVRPLVGDARDARPRVARLADDAEAALGALRASDLPRTTRTLNGIAGELTTQDRLRRLLVRAVAVLGRVQQTRLIDRGSQAASAVERMEGLLRESLRLQQRQFALAQKAFGTAQAQLAAAQATLAVARETNGHAANLDRKLGGTAPVAGR